MTDFSGQLAVVRIDDRRYGLPVLLIEEFFRPLTVTPVPGSDDRVVGLINLRGVSATVIDVRSILGLPARGPGDPCRMVMLETAERLTAEARSAGLSCHDEPVALLVDAVEQVCMVREQPFHPPPAHTGHAFAAGVYEMADGYVTLLSIPAILAAILPQRTDPETATS